MLIQALGYYAAIIALGAAAGGVFALAWRRFLPPGAMSRFWVALSVFAFGASTLDSWTEFVALYKKMARELGGFLARNLAVTVIGIGALVAVALIGLFPVQARYDAALGRLTVSPLSFAPVLATGEVAVYGVDGHKRTAPTLDGAARVAACWSPAQCLGLDLLNFHTLPLYGADKTPGQVIIVRADHGDINPLFPYLSDLEGAFFLVFALAATFGVAWPRKGNAERPAGIVKAGDFALVHLNEQLRPLVHLAGRLENRLAKLPPGPIDRPIFITGLARAGTTTVLNALTQSSELASHLNRDFPFIAAPLTWNAIVGRVGKEGRPVERLHKDRVLVNAASPDAFSEVLWQYYFPQVHDPAANQRLTARTSHPRFEAFAVNHIKKIQRLRGASRYVSKANYNVGRIEYLARLFPDARFLIPVRSPLAHIASLVRQHELFTGYARTDPRVPLYLAAAGHYEFGPQRRPISYAKAGAAQTLAAFAAGDEALGYAHQWAMVYDLVERLKASDLGDRIMVIDYAAFCADPSGVLADIVGFCGLADPQGAIAAYAASISISEAPVPDDIVKRRAEISEIVGPVAKALSVALD